MAFADEVIHAAQGDREVFYQHLVDVFPIPRRLNVQDRFDYLKEQLAGLFSSS